MGLHEGTEEVLAIANYSRASPARYPDSVDARLSGRALCIYLVLGEEGYGAMNYGRFNETSRLGGSISERRALAWRV